MKKLDYTIVFVSDMKRSVEFYRDVFGLALKSESPHWTEFATEGTILALHPADSITPERSASGHSPAGSCHPGFVVENLDAFADAGHVEPTSSSNGSPRQPQGVEPPG